MRKQTALSDVIERHSAADLEDIPDIARLWMLRALVLLGGDRALIGADGFNCTSVPRVVGLGHYVVDPDAHLVHGGEYCSLEGYADGASRDRVRADLRRIHAAWERKSGVALPPVLRQCIERLAALVGLNPDDEAILGLVVLMSCERLLRDCLNFVGDLSPMRAYRCIAILLDIPEHRVRRCLSPDGMLARSALVTVDRRVDAELPDILSTVSRHFAEQLIAGAADPVALLNTIVIAAPAPELAWDDFAHLWETLGLLERYLRSVIDAKRPGINALIYGPPGTGKTQLTRILAAKLGLELFDVAVEDEDGNAISGEPRLRAFRAGQCLLARGRTLMAFDEAEDAFAGGHGFFGAASVAQARKGWINRMLEENPVPTIWLSNNIGDMDPAFVRRFDLVVEAVVPPKRQRERILRVACGDLLQSDDLSRLADCRHLAPAVIHRSARVVRSAGMETLEARTALETAIAATLRAQGLAPPRRVDATLLPEFYDPLLVNADAALRSLAEGLAKSGAGRLLLHGPPGSGKSAFARWLADETGLPLMARRASDLLSPFVGGTERAIASAFLEAEHTSAILLVDEVDGLLQDRREASRSWEIQQVNEFLVRMEEYSGLLITTTNRLEALEPAAIRRFDFKVGFDYLEPEQSEDLLCRSCAALSLDAPTPADLAALQRLDRLTPGYFATVARRHKITALVTASAFVEALADECRIKDAKRRPIGFA